MKIIIDAMGGDFAPEAPVRGALLAREKYGADIILTGRTADILRELEKAGCKEVPQGIEIANAEEVVEICDDPATAFKQKKDSSLTVGLNLLRDGQADGFISAGSTGALLAGATLVVKRIRGLRRAALAPTIPTMTGKAVLIDCGANAECTSEYLLQFAYLGSYYAEKVLGIVQPRVGLLNIGAEPSKGDTLRHETYARLKEAGEQGHLNFIGNIEANTALAGGCDVIVADGYSGNIMLKSVEGAARLMSGELKKNADKERQDEARVSAAQGRPCRLQENARPQRGRRHGAARHLPARRQGARLVERRGLLQRGASDHRRRGERHHRRHHAKRG